ncbi:MAG: methyltransferase domain-containing protein [Actinobacteria bacterium]|jgi:2-polyprenyl-3-methyl-5-hydroxy-6-metoxy-1,4-benzoquinol methylase|nr:methyltransferase domain-containing protein [Actinomycetota bacterium]
MGTDMRTEFDAELYKQTIHALFTQKQGEVMSAVIHIGQRVGLFSALVEHGPCTSEQLAEATGLHERWVREWLAAIGSANFAEHHDGVFALTPEATAALVTPDFPGSLVGVFGPPITHREIDRTVEAFSTGIGMTWDEHGADTCHFQAAMGAAGQRAFLVPVMLGSIDEMTDKLTKGITVVDIGCGAGVAATVLAEAYPNSTVIGIDPSSLAITEANKRAQQAGLSNLEFREGMFDDLDGLDDVGLLLTLDVIHDLARPGAAVRSAASCLADDGVWIVADIRTKGGLEDNRRMPMLPLFYGMSVLYCMSSAMSEPGGAGLGTLGLTEQVFGELTAAAGLRVVQTYEHEVDIMNRYYEVRK